MGGVSVVGCLKVRWVREKWREKGKETGQVTSSFGVCPQ